MKNFFRTILLFTLFCFPFGGWGAYAQLYPVQITTVFNSPYSVKISDYATSMDTKMQLLINPTDIAISQRQVRLKLYIQGNGLNVQSSDYIQGQRPIFINGGELQTLTNTDISALFRLENLQGISAAQYANGLPDGMYSFCFEMYDFATNQKISQKSCASLYLILNDPPLLNTPQKNEQIASTEFPNILFTWTPRQINATNISYKFELKQLIDPTLDPQIGFQMSPILYEETLFSTALLYNLSMPILTPGMRYAWRVRAISTTGLSENAVFKNDGYSEIYSFKYTSSCTAPTFLLSESQSSKSVKITWEGVPEHTRYQVQYKKQDVPNAQWFSTNSLNTQSLITNLEPGVTYQFRVGSSCDPAADGVQSFTYSGISNFTIPTETSGVAAYNCGIIPQINIENQKPLTNLIQSETFKAGDFPVTILELQGENSPYSGKGYIIVPYLADTKIAVEFNNIVINTDYQLISGIVETSYNPEWKNVGDVEDFTGEGQGGQIEETVPFIIKDIVINANGDIVVNGIDGQQVTIPGGKDTVITDSGVIDADGKVIVPPKVYTVDSAGNGSNQGVVVAEGGKPTPENTDGVDKSGQATAFTAKGISIAFSGNGSKYAFDVMPEKATAALQKLYKKVGDVALPYKAVINGDTDTVLATVNITDASVKADSIVFKTQNGAKINFTRNDKVFVLNVKGSFSYAEEQILATIKQGKKWKVIGAFMLVHISRKEVNVALVPTDDTSRNKLDKIIANTQAIYDKVGVKINFKKEEVLNIDSASGDTIKTEKNTLTSTYSAEQQNINALYHGTDNSYVLFITNKPSSTGQDGYMRLNGQFGYVFPSNNETFGLKTPAHELGHGIFKLEHPFETYKTSESSTNLLMDYSEGTVLNHQDWKQINDPAFKLYAFQSQASGEQNKYAHLALTPSGIVIDEFYLNSERIAIVFVVTKNYTINTIKYNDKNYEWSSTAKAFINGSEKIIPKKVSKTINNKVNLFRSRGDGCTYDYVLIEWNTEDEKVKDINARVQEKLKSFADYDWKLSPLDIKDASCSNNFAQELLERDQKACSSSEIQDGVAELKEAMKLTDGEKVATSVNNACMSAIRNLTYTEIESLIKIIATQTDIKERSELAILRLMSAIKTDNYANYYTFLEKDTNKVLKKLIDEIDDVSVYFLTDKKNYTNFIGALVTMFNQAPKSIESRWPKETDNFAKIVINLEGIDYSSDTSSIFSPVFTSKCNDGEYNKSTGNITVNDIYTTYIYNTFDFKGSGVKKIEHIEVIEEVSPLTPIIIVPKQGKLPLVATALGDNNLGDNSYIVPAIFLKYQKDKIRNDYIEKGIITALDIATIYLSGGTALAAKVTWIRRAWAMAEVAGAVGNIAVNTETIDPKSNLGKAINAYNIGMGVIGLKNVAVGGYKFVSSLPATTKALLRENKGIRSLLIAHYTEWRSLTTNIDKLSSAERKLITEQEEVWKVLGFVDKLGDMVYKNVKFEDFTSTVSDFAKGAKSEIAQEAYKLWGENKWDELYDLFKNNKLNDWGGINWPPFSGFAKINEIISAKNYKFRIDRFQKESSLGGGFGSPILKNSEGVDDLVYTYDSRMLSDKISEGMYYFVFQMSDKAVDVELKIGDVAPWFKKQMNLAGEQIEFSKKLHVMDATYFKNLEAKVFVNGKWRNCVIEGKGVITELQVAFNKLPIDVSDDLVDYINSSSKVLSDFKEAQKAGKLDEMVTSFEIFRKNNIKKPCL
ncbi:fibronectin type III domain-containing protein [Flavobacterium geliluteum]|uniref:Fibronectin type III domain-containing protein n=1 Tax=Flavobacterium geliluteum TaxID=2816120 RepID=A0A940X749_9FLAO|nr:fibronectin type III domain-containing protein [Flavobacterium geliluteum]MBP4137445.1 fibronectin type III domain-containing protein [Flavobacterium geliluteum]